MTHGKSSTYSKHKCRCDECRDAWRLYCVDYRRKRGVRPLAEYLAAVTIEHGYLAYKRRGCRCQVCKDAAAEAKRRQRHHNIEHYREYDRARKRAARAA